MSEKIITEAEARRLAKEIRTNLLDLEKNLKFFHAVQGWIPMGYDSFTTWWDNEMRDIPIAAGIRNWAIYAMIDENLEGNRIRRGMTSVIAHATSIAPTTVSSMRTRARPRFRYQGRPDSEMVPFGIGIPNLWHRHLISLSNSKDQSMADLVRPIIKDGMLQRYGIDLDAPIDNK